MHNVNNIGIEATPAPTYGPPRWMMSFADLMSVILTFFVLMFSLSTAPKHILDKENKLTKTAQAPYSVKKNNMPTDIKTAKTDQGLSTNYLADVIKNKMAIYPALSKAKLENLDDRLIISIAVSEFNDDYAANIAQILKNLPNRSAIYSANLDQSYAVMRKLQEQGLEKNIAFLESHDSAGKIDIAIYP